MEPRKWLTILIIILLGYIAPMYSSYLYMKASFSKGGNFETLKPGITEIALVVIPGINWGGPLFWIIEPPRKRLEEPFDSSKFFNIKK